MLCLSWVDPENLIGGQEKDRYADIQKSYGKLGYVHSNRMTPTSTQPGTSACLLCTTQWSCKIL